MQKTEGYKCQNCITHTCHGRCQRQLPAHAFDRDAKRRCYKVCRECQHPTCATCEQRSAEIWKRHPKIPNEVYRCPACKRRKTAERQCTACLRGLPPSAFGRNTDGSLHKVCHDCQFPTCFKCKQKSTKMWHQVPKENNVYVCDHCRPERICKGRCGRSLPPSAFARDKQRRMYQVCRDCQSKNKKQLSK